uniref:G_PROTEIN_RECEP_F1_2 domain-containing protein n=1 Tax=Steinernema glaseri TaxID=37863 RepID=A0A1I8A268_9BILA
MAAATNMSNDTVPSMILFNPDYMRSAIIVMSTILPCFVPNVFILVVGLKSGVIQDKFRDSIVAMTSANLVSAVVPFLFHAFYMVMSLTKTPIGFFLCSFLRRITTVCYSPMLYGCVIVAVDRFFVVCRNKSFSRTQICILNLIFMFYPTLILAFQMTSNRILNEDICGPTLASRYPLMGEANNITLIFAFQMTSNRILNEDICGPTLASRYPLMGEANNIVLLVYPLIAFCLNIYILFYVGRKARTMRSLGAKVNSRNTRQERHVLLGMIIQSLMPVFSQVPMLASTLVYYRGIAVPAIVWSINNVIYHIELTLNPVFTVLFVKQFRQAVAKVFNLGKNAPATTQVSTVNPSTSRSVFTTTRSS